ncbi:MAG: UDP-N-acetylmuramate--L-alanine ligase [Acidimicrobiales bacterium]
MTTLDLRHPRAIHIVAVGGAGMSGIATLLAESGHRVTGSDQSGSDSLDRLAALGVTTWIGHDAAHVGDVDAVAVSTAVADDNPEVVEARRRGLPILRRIDVLPALAAVRPLLSVSGTHGKTTTTSMLTVAMRAAGEDVSYLIGAAVPVLGGAAGHRTGRFLVLEADESDGSFLSGPRAGAIVTNVEPDHLEYWGGFDALNAAFVQFLEGTDGPRVVCADDPGSAALAERVAGCVTYGQAQDAIYRMADLNLGPDGSTFVLHGPGGAVEVRLSVPGAHNATNAAGALALLAETGLDPVAGAAGLATYTGVARRFERRGEADGVTVVDDYAHLPTEVRAALAAGRSGGWPRVVAVFQPHRYSRTAELWASFADAFGDADVLVLTDIYAAGETPRPGVSGKLIVDAVLDLHPWRRLAWMPTLDDAAAYLVAELRAGDLCMTIGAGDVTTLGPDLIEALTARGRR